MPGQESSPLPHIPQISAPQEFCGTDLDDRIEPPSQLIPLRRATPTHSQTEATHDGTNKALDADVITDPITEDVDPAKAVEEPLIEGCTLDLDTDIGSVPSSPEAEDDDSYEESGDETVEPPSRIRPRGFLPIAPKEPSQQNWLMDVTPSAPAPTWPHFGQTVQSWLMTDSGGRKVIPSLAANARLSINVEFDHKINAHVVYRRNNITVENIECRLLVPDFCHATESLWIQQTDRDARIPIKEFFLRLRGQFLHEKREPILLQLVGSRPTVPDKIPKDIEIDPQWAIMDTNTDTETPKYAARLAFQPSDHSPPSRFNRIQFGESTRKNRKNSRKQQDLVCLKVQLMARVEDRIVVVSEIRSPYLMVRGKCPIFHSEDRATRVRKRRLDKLRRARSSEQPSAPPVPPCNFNMMGWKNIAPRSVEQ